MIRKGWIKISDIGLSINLNLVEWIEETKLTNGSYEIRFVFRSGAVKDVTLSKVEYTELMVIGVGVNGQY